MRELASGTESLAMGASVPSDSLMAVTIELGTLENELKACDSPDFGEPDVFIPAPLKPRPHLSSGAIELREPEDEF